MWISDFEKAIARLGCRVVLDEVKICHGVVRRCYGHQGQTLVMWDGAGRGFSLTIFRKSSEEELRKMQETLGDNNYERDNVYDLKLFE